VLLPALAFDERGFRLGYGGGFYDRLLADWPVLTVGVTPEALVLSAVPREAHDVPVAYLATERGVRRVKVG
jgi:5-formyltetrahydrofolate cyclo-ligase